MIKLGEPKAEFLHEDEHLVIIPDIYPEAEAHYQVVTKRHIKDFAALKLDQKHDNDLLVHMHDAGLDFLLNRHF